MQFFPRRHAEASRLSASWPLGRPAPAAGPPPLDFRPRPGRGFPAALGDIADVGSHPADRPWRALSVGRKDAARPGAPADGSHTRAEGFADRAGGRAVRAVGGAVLGHIAL